LAEMGVELADVAEVAYQTIYFANTTIVRSRNDSGMTMGAVKTLMSGFLSRRRRM
jgi:pyruvate-formate lyase